MGELLKRYRSLFEKCDNGIVIAEIIGDGHDFKIKDLNRIPELFVGKTKNEIIGKELSKVFPCVKNLGLISKMREVFYKENNKNYSLSYYENKDLKKTYKFNIIKLANDEIAVKYRN